MTLNKRQNDTCGICTRPTRNAAYTCDDCGDSFASDLKALVDWLDEDLETSVGGAKGVEYKHGRLSGGGGDEGLRVNWRAAKLYRELQRALCGAVDHCLEARVRHVSKTNAEPARTVSAMAEWLRWRVDGLALDAQGPKHVKAIGDLVDQAKAVVFWTPPERQFLGSCSLCGEGGDVYAEDGAEEAYCSRCEKAFPAEVLRVELVTKMYDKLMTAAEIAKMSTYFGLRDNRERVQWRISKWHERKRITEHGSDGAWPRFRFGDIYPLLLEHQAKSG